MGTLTDGFGTPTPKLPEFQIPNTIAIHEYPKVIRDFEKWINRMRRKLAEEKNLRDGYVNMQKKVEWKALGTNEKERDAGFALYLEGDETYSNFQSGIMHLEWAIKDEESELKKVESEFGNARLRMRNAVVAAELFGGIAINPADLGYA